MTARVHTIFETLKTFKSDIEDISKSEGISQDLLWIMVRQQADYELLLLAEQTEAYTPLANATL